MNWHRSSQAGFTLIEAALVVAIGGIAMAAAESALYGYQQDIKKQITQSRLQKIDEALIHYLDVNGVLPCVAGMTIAADQPNFGIQVTDYTAGYTAGKDCKGTGAPGIWQKTGIAPPPNATNTVPGDVIIGAVPVRTLNLPDQYIADAWGNYFVYAVTDALTISTPVMEYDQTQGAIVVQDGETPTPYDLAPIGGALSAATPAAQYVLVSYGPDGAGAYTMNGKNGVACPPGTTETLNCQAVSGAAPPPLRFIKTAQNSDKTGANRYDDYVTYHTLTSVANLAPAGMITPMAGITVCPPGWKAYNDVPLKSTNLATGVTSTAPYVTKAQGAACAPSGAFICCEKN